MVRQPPDVNRPDSPFPAATLFRALAARLPLDDPQDFANAARGKIAEIKDGLIVAKDGKVIWDRRAYDFLNGTAAPDTVNPSLWRQARLNAIHGLFRSEEHTSALQSLMRISYAVFCLKKKTQS